MSKNSSVDTQEGDFDMTDLNAAALELLERSLPTVKGVSKHQASFLWRLGLPFFIFGLFNSIQYFIILSAALDLVPPSTPKGVVAFFDNLLMRLLGIAFASFSVGLGELTFLQKSTTYTPSSMGSRSVDYFASGTGAAGLIGAFLWWELRSLGVRTAVGLSAIMPFVTPFTYFLLLPPSDAVITAQSEDQAMRASSPTLSYVPLVMTEDVEENEEGRSIVEFKTKKGVVLDKWHHMRPLFLKYMLPLFAVYLFEYTINQGISPTLLYPIPSPEHHALLSKIIHSKRDYYPLWQLVYQTTAFFSRSSIVFGIPLPPVHLLPLPSILQGLILLTLAFESAVGFFPAEYQGLSIAAVFALISIEGLCGGLAYVNVFYWVNQEPPDKRHAHDDEWAKRERERKIGMVGLSDSLGIVCASLVAVPTEVALCRAQVRRGKMLCKGL